MSKDVVAIEEAGKFIPEKDPLFFSDTDEYHTARIVVESRKFFPVWITGPKGSGKSSTIKQICAELDREFIRVNFNQETDESELFGSIELVDGTDGATNTKFNEGPVIEAMRRGAVLMLDEVDVAHPNKVLCLQSVLEGQPAFIKSQNMVVEPAEGFTVFATSNTKGKGCDTGEYIGTNIMNGAFLDRFAATIEQSYPTKKQEAKLLQAYYARYVWIDGGLSDKDIDAEEKQFSHDFLKRLCLFAEHVRKAYEDGASEEVISTRTLISIIKCYSIFKDESTAIGLACARYGEASKLALLGIYKNLFDIKSTKVDKDGKDIRAEFVDKDVPIL